jgi:hypothetical protein
VFILKFLPCPVAGGISSESNTNGPAAFNEIRLEDATGAIRAKGFGESDVYNENLQVILDVIQNGFSVPCDLGK